MLHDNREVQGTEHGRLPYKTGAAEVIALKGAAGQDWTQLLDRYPDIDPEAEEPERWDGMS